MTTTTKARETTGEISIDLVAPHPQNPRKNLTNIDALTKSVQQHGVLQPITILPANNDGIHLVIAGHRRLAAAAAAELDSIPYHVRDLTPAQVLVAMLTENRERDDLTVSEEVQALVDLDALDDRPTRKELAKQLGVSTAWLRTRFRLAAAPAQLLKQVDNGTATVAHVEAATNLADLGEDHMITFVDQEGHRHGDPKDAADQYRNQHIAHQKAVTVEVDLNAKGITVGGAGTWPPSSARPLDHLTLDTTQAEHVKGDCHAVSIRIHRHTDEPTVTAYCTKPNRHRSGTTNPSSDESARRKARKARLEAFNTAINAKRPSNALTAQLAIDAVLRNAVGSNDYQLAAKMLGAGTNDYHHTYLADLLDSEGDPNTIAVAIAFAAAENTIHSGHGTTNSTTDAYLEYLAKHGNWEPDNWTTTKT